ncbi:hypothetical protein DFJ74DRAFT_713484 [Hyaloraphidium curvatum]|nr:hypothetical protein DFJ74DRAFT_713484 [Hyaloraphidium curvatum]
MDPPPDGPTPPLSVFDASTAVRRLPSPPSLSHFASLLPEGYARTNGRVPGNHMLAVAMRCLLLHAGCAGDPLAAGFDFLAPARPGDEIRIEVEDVKRGRNVAVFLLRMYSSAGRPLIVGRATFGALARAEPRQLRSPGMEPPYMPPADECVSTYNLPFVAERMAYRTRPPEGAPAILSNVERLADPSAARAFDASADPMRAGSLPYRMHFRDGRAVDFLSLAYFSDQLPANAILMDRADVRAGRPRTRPTTLSINLQFISHPSPGCSSLICADEMESVSPGPAGMPGTGTIRVRLWEGRGGRLLAVANQTVQMSAMGSRGTPKA